MLDNRWNQARYRLYAPIYDIAAKPLEQGRRRAIERLDLTAGDHILLLGCGTGLDLKYLPTDIRVTAIDVTPEMVHKIQERVEGMDTDVDVQIGDAELLPFEKQTFDAVLLHLILSVVPDPEEVVTETARVLTANGTVSIYDKFVPPETTPSIWRRITNPFARLLFADITRQLDPLISNTSLSLTTKESHLAGIYTITIAHNANP